MKPVLQIVLFLSLTFSLSAQSNVTLKINHFLNGEEFEYDVVSKNDLGNDFMVDRLEYYLSTFSITHDGGQITTVDDLYFLVSLESKMPPSEIDLGTFDIQNIESINFYFGIDEETNHSDPALWPIDHPLAPKFPSMHWGWAAGYRFIALEGLSGANVDQELQFHCIGDEFYKEMSFPVSMSGEDSYEIEIDAEYNNLLSGIDVSNGLILHGNLNEIKTLAKNLNENVFTVSEITNTEDNELINTFEVFPNPTMDGQLNIRLDIATSNTSICVHDAFGRLIQKVSNSNANVINLNTKGLFLISVADNNGKTLATRKVIVQ